MKRLYFLADSLEQVRKISDDLHHQGLNDWQFSVLSRNEAGLFHHHVHSANLFQQNDVIHSGEIGAIVGGTIAFIAALIVELLTPFGDPMPLPIVILASVFFVLFGVWSGGLAGTTRENYKTTHFHDELVRGKHLIMIDASKHQAREVQLQLAQYHMHVTSVGEDSPWTQPFSRKFWTIPRHI